MSIIDSFDDKTEEIVKPINQEIKDFPKTAILIFKERFINYMQEEYGMKIIGSINAGTIIPVYKLKYKETEFAIIRTLIGGAGTAGIIEELIAMGAKNILIYGTCGTLDKDILKGHFVIPTEAYRDEGVSYHYIEKGDFIEVNTANDLAKIFDEYEIPYVMGKTWTTDAFYRETKGNMERRKKEGCIVVDMECASAMSVGKFRNIPIYQFLYGDDTLDSEKWDRRKLQDYEKEIMEKNIINIGFKVAYEIDSNINIRYIKEKEKYIQLLLEADPEEKVIKKYINEGDMYGIFNRDELQAEILITKVNDEICELKNIATVESSRGQGYSSKLIEFVFEKYKSKYKRMIVGTTENMIPFYVLNGFTKYYKTVKNFFIDNYEKEIYDGDMKCIDIYYYYKDLTK